MIVNHKEVEGQCAEPEEMEVCRLDGCKENSSLLVCCNKSPITPSSYHSHCFSYKLLLNTFCILSINQAFLIMSMSALPHPLSLPLIQNFSLTVPSPQTRGSIVFPDMPWSPRPSMHLHSVCVSQLENSCHIQPSHAAQLRQSATFPVNSLHLCPSFPLL